MLENKNLLKRLNVESVIFSAVWLFETPLCRHKFILLEREVKESENARKEV